jgi:hypothetical protein
MLCRALLVIGLVSLGRPCLAQEVDAPNATGDSGEGSVFAPSGWLELIVPVRDQVDLQLLGFYIGELNVPVAQLDVPIRATNFLTITPSYMYYWVPATGQNELTNPPGEATEDYDEHQFRIDGTFILTVRKFEISDRNMYVRRFRPSPLDDSNRYRNRFRIAYPLAVRGQTWSPFAAYETYWDGGGGGWNKDRVWVGVTLPIAERVWLQPSYMWEASDGIKDIHYLLFGLVIRLPSQSD